MGSNPPTVALCMFIHNEMHILRRSLFYEMRWADQVCILDMASTDGLREFCEVALRPQDVYVRREQNTCAKLGFAEAKNAAIALSTCDWAYFAGANSVIDWNIAPKIKGILQASNAPVLQIRTVNVLPPETELVHAWERDVKAKRFDDTHVHRNFIRKGSGVDIKGYIHEEPHMGEEKIRVAEDTPIVRYHFTHPSSCYTRLLRYAWMFRRMAHTPELQKYTDQWWYANYYPENKQMLDERARQFELLFGHELV